MAQIEIVKKSSTYGFYVPIEKRTKGLTPLWTTSDGEVYYSRGSSILLDAGKASFAYGTPRSVLEVLFGWNALARRVLRIEINALTRLNNNLIAIKKGAILVKRPEQDKFQVAHRISRGSRPLNLCQFEGRVYWGEYFANPSRSEVHIYGTRDGVDWEVAYTFPKGRVRHIHGIYRDPIRKGMWVLTGDTDYESGLWFTEDHFQTLTCVKSGTQKARAVSVIPTKKGLVVPMDSPQEINFIQEFDLEEHSFTPLKQLAGSAFYRYATPSISIISTVVEPSTTNLTKSVEVMASLDNEKWIKIADLTMDFWATISLKIFRYPEVRFPEVSGGDPDLIRLYCSGVCGYNHNMVVLKRTALIAYLKAKEGEE